MTTTEKGQIAAELFADEPAPSTALAVIDSMADDLLFTPNAVTDAQLAAGRDWYLTEAKKYDISTDKARTEFKRFARPLQKLRTGIEARAKELTGKAKRQLAAIDTEKRRLVGIVGGIEDEVLAPLTSWEQEEEARKVRLAGICSELAAKGQRVYMDMAEIQAAIVELEAFKGADLFNMQEYSISAESAITSSLKVLKPELERRKEMEAQAAELAKLRAEAAERAEQDRQATLAKIALQQAEQETAARKAEAGAAVEAERKRAAAQAAEEYRAMEARAADEKHRVKIKGEIRVALLEHSSRDFEVPVKFVDSVVEAIVKGLIPHVTINY